MPLAQMVAPDLEQLAIPGLLAASTRYRPCPDRSAQKKGKRSSKASAAAFRMTSHPILDRLKIDPDNYVRFINRTQKSQFHGFIGTVKSMRSLAQDFGRSFLRGQAAAAALFSPG